MTGKRSCAVPGCGQREHGDNHPRLHEYLDPTKAGLQPMSRGRRAYLAQRVPEPKYDGQICAAQVVNVCSIKATEEHHVLPRSVAGLEVADRYPKVWLCHSCHDAIHHTPRGRKFAKERGLLLSYSDIRKQELEEA